MKKKINMQFMLMASLSILFALCLITATFYDLFRKQVFEDLRIYTHVMKSMGNLDKAIENGYDPKADDLRITLVAQNGEVVYDSNVEIEALDNHGGRPEITEAFQKGEGEEIRKSATVGKNIFYYAILLESGSVLRVAKEAESVGSIFLNVIPVIAAITVLLLALSLLLSHILTKSIIRPIEKMAEDMEHMSHVETYEELRPFVTMINTQHEDIVRNANMRQDFTANVSHELKTPLTSISGYAELIENEMASPADTVRFAAEIHKSAKRLLNLINDIIRLSEFDAAERTITFEEVNLYAMADTCVELLRINADQRKIRLLFSGEPVSIRGNKEMMEELLYNLCDNAIRYNVEGGSVWVEVLEEDGQAVISVRDTGIGIPSEHQGRIFERFYRVDKSRSKSTGGTGLGLAIVKHIVAKHNAVIRLKSRPGKGTEIKIIFLKEANNGGRT